MLLLSDTALVDHLKAAGTPLPISLSALRKARIDGRLSIPYRRIGGLALYCPDEVLSWLAGIPVIQPQRHPALVAIKRRGKPTKSESIEASRRGITVPELRAQKSAAGV